MSVKPDIKYGLNVNRSFTDISDREEALENLGLAMDDLEVIRESSSEGSVSRNDVKTVSGLDKPIQRYLVRIKNDIESYKSIINQRSGIDQRLRGNLEVNGILSSSSIKYNYLEDDSNEVKSADISTSRVSSWSSSESPVLNDSPIFYGGDLEVGGNIEAKNLNITDDISPVLFKDSEKPTHKIEATVDGSTMYFYAMRGIPIIFKSFFRNMDADFSLDNNGAISIRIDDLDNPNYTVEYENIGGLNAKKESLTYRSSRSSRKNVEIYHDPNNIESIILPRIGLIEYPSDVVLSNLKKLILDKNNLKDFPDFVTLAPKLTYLKLDENDFFRSDHNNIKKFNQNVVDRLPPNIETLILGNTFTGSITGDLTTLTRLKNIDLSSNRSPNFNRDIDDPSGSCPEVANSVQNYNMRSNNFRGIPQSVMDLPELVSINLYSNNIREDNFKIESNNIEYINIGRNVINVPNMSGNESLESFYSKYSSNRVRNLSDNTGLVMSTGAYKFKNCSNLNRIEMRNSYYRGYVGKFEGNGKLSRIDLYRTELSGGVQGDSSRVLFSNTFDDCQDSIKFFRLSSTKLLNAPIDSDVFRNTEEMEYLYIRSYNRGVSGNIPDLSSMKNLKSLYLHQNNLTGPVPRFSNNLKLQTVVLSQNKLTGSIPLIESTTLSTLNLQSNELTTFTKLDTPYLKNLYLHSNNLSGKIPNISNLTRLRKCYLNDNEFKGYDKGMFSAMTNLRSIDISNNDLTESDINSILKDLLSNYSKSPRNGVTVNIRGNSVATGEGAEIIPTLQSYGWTIRN